MDQTLESRVIKFFSTYIYYTSGLLVSIATTLWARSHNFGLFPVVFIAILLFLIGKWADINTKLIAIIYTNRQGVTALVLVTSILFAQVFLHYYSPMSYIEYFKNNTILIIQFVLQGALVGVVMRMLLLHLFSQIIRSRDTEQTKSLVLFSWLVFFIMFPLGSHHISLSPAYIWGFAIGFVIHYGVRRRDRKQLHFNRFRKHIIKESSTQATNSVEKIAIDLFVNRKWKKLSALLLKSEETEILIFINLSMLRMRKKYSEALHLIKEILKNNPQNTKHFYYLHAALNESDRSSKTKIIADEAKMFSNLKRAYSGNSDCMLTCSTYALKIASKTNLTDQEKKQAFDLIWNAMDLSEKGDEVKIISLITGMTIPLTYTYLLDIYAYVLYKQGKYRIGRELLYQCLFQNPNHSSTYLHLAEVHSKLCVLPNKNFRGKYRNWKTTVNTCLNIAIVLEKQNGYSGEESFIMSHSRQLMKEITKLP